MSLVRVIDTNIAIGLAVKQDKHHQKSREYVVEKSGTVYLPPTAKDEFDDLKDDIENELRTQLAKHESKVDARYGTQEKLTRDDLQRIRDNLVDEDSDVAKFLRDYYDDLITEFEVYQLRVQTDLQDFISEVGDDPCDDVGGWRNVVEFWTRGVDPYPSVRKNLLIYEGDDCDVCIDAHHIATKSSERTELGTADGHFIDKQEQDDKDIRRKENIIQETALDDVVDLRP